MGCHQFTGQIGRRFSGGQINRPAHGPPVAMTQREPLVIRARAAQKLANLFRLTPGLSNRFQCRVCVKLTGLNALQQTALKRPATFRTPGVNPAKPAIKTGARLRESLLAAFFHQRQSKISKPLRVITFSQFHVGKQNTIAAQPALRTELVNAVHLVNRSSRCESAQTSPAEIMSGLTPLCGTATKSIDHPPTPRGVLPKWNGALVSHPQQPGLPNERT